MDLAPGAWRWAAVPALVGLPSLVVVPLFGLCCLALVPFVLWFHRDPDRVVAPAGVVAPADGRVSVVREEDGRVRLGVFMNVTDVHVNRAPMDATVASVTHEPGGHWPAFSKASGRNERVRLDCGDHEVVLIAGTVARRVHPYVEAGERVERGQRVGHISFGSRVDVVMPPDVTRGDLTVAVGDRVEAGVTAVAHRPENDGTAR